VEWIIKKGSQKSEVRIQNKKTASSSLLSVGLFIKAFFNLQMISYEEFSCSFEKNNCESKRMDEQVE